MEQIKRILTVLEQRLSVQGALVMSQRYLGTGEQINKQVGLWASFSTFTLFGKSY